MENSKILQTHRNRKSVSSSHVSKVTAVDVSIPPRAYSDIPFPRLRSLTPV